jgi:hypothetical protein
MRAAARAFFGDLLGLTELRKPEPLRARGAVEQRRRAGRLGRRAAGVRRFYTTDPWGNRLELSALDHSATIA